MNPFIKQLVNQKMNRMTPKELENLGRKYGLKMSNKDAYKVMEIIHSHPIDIFNEQDRKQLLRKIAQTTNGELAKNMEQLFHRFLRWVARQGK